MSTPEFAATFPVRMRHDLTHAQSAELARRCTGGPPKWEKPQLISGTR
ncbi:hypothetical protein [Actinocrispum sp. NPDC049592]